jgi:rare lipoprotein A
MSYAAAETAAVAPASAAAGGFWVQIGAFRQREGAHELRDQLTRELAWLEPWLAIIDDRALYRLQAGPYATRSEAQGTAERIRGATSVQPRVLQRR